MSNVSIIIPCFNQGRFLKDTLQAVLNQSYTDYECIVVNDGSTDNSLELAQTACAKDKRLNVISQINGGLSSARNKGIRHTNAQYILLWDADDLFESTFLEKAVAILQNNPEVGFVTCYVQRFGIRSEQWSQSKSGGVELFLASNNNVACCLLRRQLWVDVNGFDESMLSGYEDWDFWLRATFHGWKCYVIQEHLFWYRQHRHSMLHSAYHIHQALFSALVLKNEEIYKQYLVTFAVATLVAHKAETTNLRKCYSFRTGELLLNPIVSLVKKYRAFLVNLKYRKTFE